MTNATADYPRNWRFSASWEGQGGGSTSFDIYATESNSWQRFRDEHPYVRHADFTREHLTGLALYDDW